jgi:sugar phosphate isomerase/epimerase
MIAVYVTTKESASFFQYPRTPRAAKFCRVKARAFMKSAITLCQVPEAASGPFVFRSPLPLAFATAAELGFDAVELFLPGPDFISVEEIQSLSATHGLAIAAVGTGAGWLQNGLSLTHPDPENRRAALDFITSMVEFGGQLHAPAILGSMQGRSTGPESTLHLAAALRHCANLAARFSVPFLYEPLNRYETNLFNRLSDATHFLDAHDLQNVMLLADLFHMNIEETDLPAAIRNAAHRIGHVHFADSNRMAIGFGHTAAAPIIEALREISYTGYLSAEILPLPDPETAARQTRSALDQLI